jgi:hypothetical protein
MRTGSSNSISASAQGSPNAGSEYQFSPGGIEAGYSPGGIQALSPPLEQKRPFSGGPNSSFLSPKFLSPTSPNIESKLEKERWRESHSLAGYFEQNPAQVEAEPRLSTGDKMVAEWRKIEIETARERSRERSREPHPMADYQMALPPFFPKGFKDINGDDVDGERRKPKKEEAEKLLQPEMHEMDVGDGVKGHDR